MADVDYEDISFPDFNEFTHHFEEEEGKGISDPDIHQKTKEKSDPNIDCVPHPFSSNSHSCTQPPAPISHPPPPPPQKKKSNLSKVQNGSPRQRYVLHCVS